MRSIGLSILARRTCLSTSRLSESHALLAGRQGSSHLQAQRSQPQFHCLPSRRYESSSATGARPLTNRSDTPNEPNAGREEVPSYQMTFTCRKCLERSSHKISKQAYHHGTTLITCPGCKNRHLISDHLKIFSDKSITLEDILREKGQMLKKGSLDAEGNVEFWDDSAPAKKGD